jgi:hypothetical protein
MREHRNDSREFATTLRAPLVSAPNTSALPPCSSAVKSPVARPRTRPSAWVRYGPMCERMSSDTDTLLGTLSRIVASAASPAALPLTYWSSAALSAAIANRFNGELALHQARDLNACATGGVLRHGYHRPAPRAETRRGGACARVCIPRARRRHRLDVLVRRDAARRVSPVWSLPPRACPPAPGCAVPRALTSRLNSSCFVLHVRAGCTARCTRSATTS